ncbi:MAG: hypothetical protein HKN33_01240 [Pyrinomonadaceae bacterium]|nr:hypothetical protein [Pyrinomonadaceae bacterium]
MRIICVAAILAFCSVGITALDLQCSLQYRFEDSSENSNIKKVSSVLTMSYREGELLGYTFLERFDSRGRLLEKIRHSAQIGIHTGVMGRLSKKVYYRYNNSSGSLIESQSFHADGNQSTLVKYSYGPNGCLTRKVVLSGKAEKLVNQIDYAYIDLGDKKSEVIVTRKTFIGARTVTSKRKRYVSNGRQIKETKLNDAGKAENSISFEYDGKGFLVKRTNCCEFNYTHEYEYVVDTRGNWIERIEYYGRKNNAGEWEKTESLRTYRVITYYDEGSGTDKKRN